MIDLLSLFIGFHLTGSVFGIVILFAPRNKKKMSYILYAIASIILWEILFPISIIHYKRKKDRASFSNMTKEQKVEWYKDKITKANERLAFKLEAFDKLEESTLKEYGIGSSKEKWILSMEKCYAEEVIKWAENIKELEEEK